MTTKRWHTREDSGLRLDARGRWWHDDEPIEHPHIIEAFNRGLRVTEEGRYELHFGGDWCVVQVDGCAFTVVAFDVSEGDRPSVRLSDRTAEWLDVDSLRLDEEGALTCAVKGGRARARFSRAAQQQLGERLVTNGDRLELELGGRRWPTPLTLDLLSAQEA
jgi:hypothetical protein